MARKRTPLPVPALSRSESARWSFEEEHDRVILKDVRVEVAIGLHPWEMHPEKPQNVLVNVELFARPIPKGSQPTRASIIDYDLIRNRIRQWPRRKHVKLIETLLEELVGLCFQFKRVRACRVSVLKTDVFNEAAGAGVEYFRIRNET